MIRDIMRDPLFLGKKSVPAGPEDAAVADDLAETLKANADRCVGMAANMIGVARRIIVFNDGGLYAEMFNPEIIGTKEPYETEEGCLSLDGVRRVRRYKTVKVRWQTRKGETRVRNFSGWTAQIIQHEIDHCNGILI